MLIVVLGNKNIKPKSLVAYWSNTGNTEKVAKTIWKTLQRENLAADLVDLKRGWVGDFLEYDLVFFGAPSHMWLPPEQVLSFVKRKMRHYNSIGSIKLCAPKVARKLAVVFCTYSGPHTGINEAIPVNKYLGQFFEHIGFEVVGEWYVVGEFHGNKERSTQGKLGDIRGRPNKEDLAQIETDVSQVVKFMQDSG